MRMQLRSWSQVLVHIPTHFWHSSNPSHITQPDPKHICNISAWNSDLVQSFAQIWQDQDQDQFLQIDGPEKTALNWCRLVHCSFDQFFAVLRLVETSYSLNQLPAGLDQFTWA